MPSIPYLPIRSPIADTRQGLLTSIWDRYFRSLHSLVRVINTFEGINRWNLADQVTLGSEDEGYLAYVADYGHLVRWTGSVWQFAPGDVGNLFKRDFLAAPQEVGWQLMDGTVGVTYLVVGGATLTTATIDMPDLVGSPAYYKSIAAYTGAISAASGASGGQGVTISGSTATEDINADLEYTVTNVDDNADGVTQSVIRGDTGITIDPASHGHGAGTLAGDSHTHAPGTLELARIGFLPYFRR